MCKRWPTAGAILCVGYDYVDVGVENVKGPAFAKILEDGMEHTVVDSQPSYHLINQQIIECRSIVRKGPAYIYMALTKA
jgi:hypothetical protein